MKGTEQNLLKNKYPDLLKEWDYEKNIDVDVNTISFSSHKKVGWVCPINKVHKYIASINARTNISQRDKPSGCKQCFHDSKRIYNKDEIVVHRENYVQTRNTVKIGDETENYIAELLESMNYYKKIVNLGNIGANSDISITDYKNKTYYVQVKTLTYFSEEHYYLTNNCKYPDNMLIIMINKDRTRFALEFAGNITVKRLHLIFNRKRGSMYDHIMYKDVNLFIKRLKTLVPLSCTELTFNSDLCKMEYLMLQRFEKFCISNNIKYNRNYTNSESFDGIINGYKFQAKFSSINFNTQTTYQISSQKASGSLNGKVVKRHYEESDFDYIIIEVGGTKENTSKYEGDFCILSSKVLVEQNILKTKTCKGKKGFYVCPPDYTKQHWSKQYWNVIPQELYIVK